VSWVGVRVFGEDERIQDVSFVFLGDREIRNMMVGQRAVFNLFFFFFFLFLMVQPSML
jgi:hypothetical protein